MTIDANWCGESQEVNHHVQNEVERVGDGIVGDGPGSSKDDESRFNRIDEAVKKNEQGHVVQGQGVMQVPQQQPQGSVVHWERFLHIGSIRVLLVENDDSTRHIVTALLRNSNYEVIEAANGLQAWKILEDPTNHVDLVLTEVVMPCLSGFGLLCKIMSHITRKNIPVIMMSPHDSMGLVFKCLSKGAVDFLVKPIRKNELRNLWQHVWRRCHSSSGSGSESGTQTQKSVKSKSIVKYDTNSGSNDGDDNEITGLNIGDGSDDASGPQSSWTKHALEADSSQAASPWDQIPECPDSTCAQVIRSNVEISGNKWVPMTATREFQEHEEQLDNAAKGKELVIGKPINFELQPESPVEVLNKLIGTKQNTLPELDSAPKSKRIDTEPENLIGENPSHKQKAVITNISVPQINSREFEALREPVKILEINNKAIDDSKELPTFELSLKRLRGVEDTEKAAQSDRNVLRRSELSAFSRYNTTSNTFKAPNGITGSGSLLDNTLEIVKKESICDIRSHSDGNLLYPSSIGVTNNRDMGSTNRVVLKDESEATSMINGLHPSSAFRPIKKDFTGSPQQVILVKDDDMASTAMLAAPRSSHQELPIQHSHHELHFHNMERQQPLSNDSDFSLKKFAADAPHCGSSNVFGRPIEGNPGNYSLNRSASGSKHGSNGQNGSSAVVNAGGTNVESDVGLAGKSGNGDASGSGSGSRLDQDKIAQREAALTKFRQKRKRRCFRKKVQYQNRKRLAEERPRVRGQFVRRDSSNSAADN